MKVLCKSKAHMFVTMEDVCYYKLRIKGYFLSSIHEYIAVNTFIPPSLFYGMSGLR